MSATIESVRTETGGIFAESWQGFGGGRWQDQIDVRDFIQGNVTPYVGDAAFLAGLTERTRALWSRLTAMFPEERARGVYDVDAHTPASITSHAPGSRPAAGHPDQLPVPADAVQPGGGARAEPDRAVVAALPDGFKRFCAQVSIDTSSIQYESDDLLRARWGDDTAIACCVSAMEAGKQMQFFGARVNLAKTLLYAINGGRDETSGAQVGPALPPLTGDVLDYAEVMARFDIMMDWLAKTYVDALNVIHYMHDKYAYERLEMALHDYAVLRTMACGIAGLSVTADSLAAIRYATVRPVRDETGLVVDYRTDGDFPVYGNDDDRADDIAIWLVRTFMDKVRQHETYRGAVHTQSVLTITSNVVYGKHTGSTPDGRRPASRSRPGRTR